MASRLGGGANLRARGDLKRVLTNQRCRVRTPTPLASWGHLARLPPLRGGNFDDRNLPNADRVAAYKQTPTAPSDLSTAVALLRRPPSTKRFGFPTPALVSGSVDSARRYNTLAGIWSAPFARPMHIPRLSYLDDFAALLRDVVDQKAICVFARICDIHGSHLKTGMSSARNMIIFVGLTGTFPAGANPGMSPISLPDRKRGNRLHLPNSYLEAGVALVAAWRSLSPCCRFRSQPSSAVMHVRNCAICIRNSADACVAQSFPRMNASFLIGAVESLSISPRRRRRRAHQFRTGSFTPLHPLARLGFAPYAAMGESRTPALNTLRAAHAPTFRVYLLRHTCLIYGMELLAAAAYFEEHAFSTRNRFFGIYPDNNYCRARTRRPQR